ncbi:hypothetical protein IW262DRAFT_1484147 [Armillaria fumosa]|nr:hypothetical protein IW262DRAFT_1484147 [Armillaria fumosa]
MAGCASICSLLCHLRPVQCHTLNINNAPDVEYPEGAKFHGSIVNTLKDVTLSRAYFMFTQVSLVDVDIRAVLPSLCLPSLRKLDIRCSGLHLSHVTPFLSRHPTIGILMLRNIAPHDSINTLDLPLVDFNVSNEWLSVTPRYEHLLTGITNLYINPSMTVRTESVVRQRIIESIVLFPRVETLRLFGWSRCEEFARSIKAAYPRLQKIMSGVTDISII